MDRLYLAVRQNRIFQRIINADGMRPSNAAMPCAARQNMCTTIGSAQPAYDGRDDRGRCSAAGLTVVETANGAGESRYGEAGLGTDLKTPTTIDSNPVIGETLEAEVGSFLHGKVSMGNPLHHLCGLRRKRCI